MPVWKTGRIMLLRCMGERAYARWSLLNISKNIWCIITKFGTLKHQDKETKFEPGDLDLIFYVTVFSEGNDMKDGMQVGSEYLKKI